VAEIAGIYETRKWRPAISAEILVECVFNALILTAILLRLSFLTAQRNDLAFARSARNVDLITDEFEHQPLGVSPRFRRAGVNRELTLVG